MIETILDRLTKLKKTGRASWTACCPAHDDKGPSLSVTERDDGMILIHCFAGCDPISVLAAIGVPFSDLFPRKYHNTAKPTQRNIPAADVLECLAAEAVVVMLAAAQVRAGKVPDMARLATAVGRIETGRRLANG